VKEWISSIKQLADGIIHVMYSTAEQAISPSILISPEFCETKAEISYKVDQSGIEGGKEIHFYKEQQEILREVHHVMKKKEVLRYRADEEDAIRTKQTANGEVSYVANMKQEVERYSWTGELKFETMSDEMLLGLGQFEDGIYDYRGKREYLYQTNMKIAAPFLISTAGYGILIDTESDVIFENKDHRISFTIDTTEVLSYYILLGSDFDEIIYRLRELTGRASMLPRWTFGYIQSKERYQSGAELLKVAQEFRRREIPIDCMVQDWLSWEGDLWGQKTVDPKRFPDLTKLIQTLHQDHVHLMWSIWPNMNEKTANYMEFKEQGLLLPNANVYNAFTEEGRELYWRQCQEQLFSSGVDAWWCDNAEPFSDADWSGAQKRTEQERYDLIVSESKKHMKWENMNSYGLYHAKGIYEHWRKTTAKKRVVNLTRSSYLSGQRYGTILWSGDISAKWEVLRRQVTEGLKMGLCGMPYWTLDIGGFFTVRECWQNRGCNKNDSSEMLWFWDGDYENGVQDLGYQELYTRWLQLGTFLPVFRSHGTDTPREPWNFSGEGGMFYDTIVKFIRLRYQLLPYIYSCAAMANRAHHTMMRSLMFDFMDDKEARGISDSYMFGSAFYVCPVLQPMYYLRNSKAIEEIPRVRNVYLPAGTLWYDYWTGKSYPGGTYIEALAPLEQMPLYVKAGAIIPVSEPIQYADEKAGYISTILVYEGSDGTFELYNDEGDGYGFEKGDYYAIKISYFCQNRTLHFAKVEGSRSYQSMYSIRFIRKNGEQNTFDIYYNGEEGDWDL
jgi:alpha-D-xyloside xylohydrolase